MIAPRTPSERVPYSAIVDRPPLVLPGDARMVVWSIVNVEDWGIERPMPRTVLSPPMGQPLLPDLPNWAWHEYGMRVGFWRLFDCLQKFGVTPTLAINGVVCRNYPRIAQAAKDAGWEFMGHGWLQTPMHKVEDQRASIADTIEAIRAFLREYDEAEKEYRFVLRDEHEPNNVVALNNSKSSMQRSKRYSIFPISPQKRFKQSSNIMAKKWA